MIPSKNTIALFLVLLTNCTWAQNKVYKGFYVNYDENGYREGDSTIFEVYEDGTDRLTLDNGNIHISEYKDLKNKIFDYFLLVPKSNITGEQDSLKLVYIYQNGKIAKTIQLEKFVFRPSPGGCMAWQKTEYCCVWYQTGYSTYEYDKYGNCIKHVNRLDYFGDTTTIIYNTIYQYDEHNRVRRSEVTVNNKLRDIYIYQYDKNYKKTEQYNPDLKLRESKEDFFSKERLTKETKYFPEQNTTYIYTYEYENNRKNKRVTFATMTNNTPTLVGTRKYYYSE